VADTREQILQAAWELFAEKGFEDVSVRDVTNAAEVNLASVSYHFGGKDGLIQETVKRCLNPIYEYAIKLLEDAKIEFGSAKEIPMAHLITCWLRPLLLPEECGVRFDLVMRLLARYLIEIDYAVPVPSQRLLSESFKGYTDAIQAHCPHLSSEQITKQLIFVKGAAFYCGGLGGGIMQLIEGKKVESAELDREKLLVEVVSCSMLGLQGKSK